MTVRPLTIQEFLIIMMAVSGITLGVGLVIVTIYQGVYGITIISIFGVCVGLWLIYLTLKEAWRDD